MRYNVIKLASLFLLIVLCVSGCGEREMSLEEQLSDPFRGWEMSNGNLVVFYEDGSGSDNGEFFQWSITEDKRLFINKENWSETYSVYFDQENNIWGTTYGGASMWFTYLHLIDSSGDETKLADRDSGTMKS